MINNLLTEISKSMKLLNKEGVNIFQKYLPILFYISLDEYISALEVVKSFHK